MKNQYVGDIGDYGKYGLLRYLANNGIRIGVNWYLTKNDETSHGSLIDYCDIKQCDVELFDLLQRIVARGKDNKSVIDIENSKAIPNALFFNEELLQTCPKDRAEWHKRALEVLSAEDVDLVFADPDNGTWKRGKQLPRKNGEKYARIEELQDYYGSGKDVVYYCHKARRNTNSWEEKKREFKDVASDASIIVLTFHRGTQRSYIFAIHPNNHHKYDSMIREFLEGAWGTVSTNRKKPPFSRE